MLMRRRRRGEGATEYVIIAALVTTCSVTTLFSAGSSAIREVATSKRLCIIEGKDCTNAVDVERGPGEEAEGEGENPTREPSPWQSWRDNPYLAAFFGLVGWFI